MKLVLYSPNYAPELTGIGKYNGELVAELNRQGVDVHVVTAPPYYPNWTIAQNFNNWFTKEVVSNQQVVYRCPLYVPKKVNTIKRLLHLFSFSLSSAFRLMSLIRIKPDALIVIQPTLMCAPIALLYCKLTGSKSIMHIQDFEVDAMFGLNLGSGSRFKNTIVKLESWLMRRFNLVSSISHSMLEKARLKGVSANKLHYFPNWAELEKISPSISGTCLREEWGYEENDFIVLYSGNIGAKQGLEIVVEAASQVSNIDDIKFIIIGDGVERHSLETAVSVKGLSNVTFKSLQPWELMPQVLAMADVHLVIQKKGVADAVLPSKLTNILAAGAQAIVTAEVETELGRIEQDNLGIFIRIEPEDLSSLTKTIIQLYDESDNRANSIARKYAQDNMDVVILTERFLEFIK